MFPKPEEEVTLKKLGFREQPFGPSADPRFLYLSEQHSTVLNQLHRVVQQRRGLAVVEGPYGIGKSTLGRRLESIYRGDPDSYYTIYVHTASFSTEYVAIQEICDACGLPRRKGLRDTWNEFENFLVKQRAQNKNVVIILDDSQRMTPNALSILHHMYNFDQSEKLVQVLVLGQAEIRNSFSARPEILNRVYSWFSLQPLSISDTLALIQFRCNVAGRSEQFLSQSQFLRIWEVCDGIPRSIVTLCAKVIEQLTVHITYDITDKIVEAAIESFKAVPQPEPLPVDAPESA